MNLIYILLVCIAIYWIVFKVIIPPMALEKLVQLLSKNVDIIVEQMKKRIEGTTPSQFAETYAKLLQESSPKDIWLRILARKPSPFASNSEKDVFLKPAMQLKEILVDLDRFIVKDNMARTFDGLSLSGSIEAKVEIWEGMKNDLVTLNQRIADIKKVLGED